MVRVQVTSNNTLKGHKLVMLLHEKAPPKSIDKLKADFPDLEIVYYHREWADKDASGDIPDEEWADATILLTGSAMPAKELAPKMQYAQLLSAGANHVLQNPLIRDTDVALCTANGVHGPQITEWVVSTFLAFEHHIPRYLQFQQQGKWHRLDNEVVEDVVQKRVGIMGYGSIGRQLAKVCKAMAMDVHAYTLHPRNTPESRRDHSYAPPGTGDPEGIFPDRWYSGSSKEEIHEFLGSGLDLLVIAMPLTEKTRGLISKPEFEVLGKNKTFVSNIGRGPIVNTDDLIDALENDVIRGAALDVTDPEPLPEGHKLWKTKNVIITPHISGTSSLVFRRCFDILDLNLHRLSQGKELTNKVNKKEGY